MSHFKYSFKCSSLSDALLLILLFQAEKQSLEQNLQKTEENLSRQLTYAQQVSLLCPSHTNPPAGLFP